MILCKYKSKFYFTKIKEGYIKKHRKKAETKNKLVNKNITLMAKI